MRWLGALAALLLAASVAAQFDPEASAQPQLQWQTLHNGTHPPIDAMQRVVRLQQLVEYTAADGTVKKISAAEAAAKMQESMKDMEWEVRDACSAAAALVLSAVKLDGSRRDGRMGQGDKLVKKQSGQVSMDELEEKHPELAHFIGMAKFALKK